MSIFLESLEVFDSNQTELVSQALLLESELAEIKQNMTDARNKCQSDANLNSTGVCNSMPSGDVLKLGINITEVRAWHLSLL